MKMFRFILLIYLLSASPGLVRAQAFNSDVHVVGAMRQAMWEGQLYGKISLDTITPRRHLYGLGPVEHLTGELVIIDGRIYKSTVADDATMVVGEVDTVRAPFFGYAHIADWVPRRLPDSIRTIAELEMYLDHLTTSARRPFMFMLTGIIEEAVIHIVNLPEGTVVRSPSDAHIGKVDYRLENVEAEIVGFFSTEHQQIFTHHDTFLHLHLITKDPLAMGHVDALTLKPGAVLLHLPAD